MNCARWSRPKSRQLGREQNANWRNKLLKSLIATALLVVGLFAGLTTVSVAGSQDIIVENAWARASIGTNRPGAAYMILRNLGRDPVKLIGLETPLASIADIHRTETDENGISSMSPAGEIMISPGGSVALEPGGLHVMLMQLQIKMVEGEVFPLTLTFADGGKLALRVRILGIAARGPEG